MLIISTMFTLHLTTQLQRIVIRWIQFVTLSLVIGIGSAVLIADAVHAQEDDYEEWRNEQQQKYEEYLSEQDQAFLEFLDEQWKDVDVGPREATPIDNKPSDIPQTGGASAQSSRSDVSGGLPDQGRLDQQVGEAPEQGPSDPAGSTGQAPRQEPQGAGNAELSQASFSFFGVDASVPYRPGLVPAFEGNPGEESIRDFWKTLAEGDYSPTLEALQEKRRELDLSDWGYYVYVRDLAESLYRDAGRSRASDAASLWTWFVMMKSGYAVRVGFRDDGLFLLLPVEEQIFNRPQMHVDGQRYYLMVEDDAGGSLRTYEGQHEDASGALHLDEGLLPAVAGETQRRAASFSYDDERYEVEFEYNEAVLEYLSVYPNVELSVLFGAGVSSAAEMSLKEAFRSHLDGQSPRDALNILLRFSQFITEYQTDQENFGEERFLFAEETLAANASDCEDRAVLFSYLVRELLDREVVGLQWPQHVATAVKVGDGFEGQSDDRTLTVDGATYVMADPTYIGSSVGMEMPFVEGEEPDIIRFAQR